MNGDLRNFIGHALLMGAMFCVECMHASNIICEQHGITLSHKRFYLSFYFRGHSYIPCCFLSRRSLTFHFRLATPFIICSYPAGSVK